MTLRGGDTFPKNRARVHKYRIGAGGGKKMERAEHRYEGAEATLGKLGMGQWAGDTGYEEFHIEEKGLEHQPLYYN